MLLQFSIFNYRSIAEKQTLSLVAGTSAARQSRRSIETNNSFASHALKSACLFGPNAAGKTSIVNALLFFKNFVESSAKDATEGESIGVKPFRLDPNLKNTPSEFEAVFVHNEALYQYGFAVDNQRVWEEWLYSRPNKSGTKLRQLFQRTYNEKYQEYEWVISDTHVKGARETWKNATRENALFLSTAVQLNAQSLHSPFEWVQKYLRVLTTPHKLSPNFSAKQCKPTTDASNKKKILRFIQSADLKISDLLIEEEDYQIPETLEELLRATALKKIKGASKGAKVYKIRTVHKDSGGNPVEFELDEESEGSKVLFSLAGPWLDVLETGYTLIVDELHNSLHPMAQRYLVNMFHSEELNQSGAQLVFTSHDTSIMADGFLHKDQIWLLEKTDKESTHLYPLSDFSVRDVQAFQRAYLAGKYGALPRIEDFRDAEA